MASESKRAEARKTLQRLAALADIPDEVADATIESESSEVAYVDEWTRLTAEESTATETVPVSTYRELEAERVDFHARHDDHNTPDALESATVTAIEKDVPPETCSECEGAGTNACDTCRGKSHLPCPNNCGNGQVPCPTCGGTMHVTCGSCSGSGRKTCPSCRGVESDSCPKCSGGTVPCRSCGGSGSEPCSRCTSGVVTCGTCHGESVVPCGCGDGRVDCEACETDGKLVTARTAVIEYRVGEDRAVHSTLVPDRDLLGRSDATETVTHEGVDVEPPVTDGSWRQADRRDRHLIPVQYVEYSYQDDSYEVYDVNETVHSPSAPESDLLGDTREAIRRQRADLEAAYDDRLAYLRQAIDDRRSELLPSYERRARRVKAAKLVKLSLVVLAAAGLYRLW